MTAVFHGPSRLGSAIHCCILGDTYGLAAWCSPWEVESDTVGKPSFVNWSGLSIMVPDFGERTSAEAQTRRGNQRT